MFSSIMKFKKFITEDKSMFNWSNKNEVPEPASEPTWRVGCSCVDCHVARESSLRSKGFKITAVSFN